MTEEEKEEFLDTLDVFSSDNYNKSEQKSNNEEKTSDNRPKDQTIIEVKSEKKSEMKKKVENNEKSLSIAEKEDSKLLEEDDIEMSPSDSIKFLICIIIIQILGLFIIFSICHWIYNNLCGLDWRFQSDQIFNFHIFFMSLGLYALGIGILNNRLFRGLSWGALNFLHTFVTFMASVFLFAGLYSVVVTLNSMGSIHFYSVHSWLGLASIISFTLQWIAGFIVFIFPRFIHSIQILLIPIHTYSGRITFVFVCGTAIVGISDKLHNSFGSDFYNLTNITINIEKFLTIEEIVEDKSVKDEAFLSNIIAIVILIYALFVIYITGNDKFRRRPLPEEQGIETKATVL